LLGEPRLVNLEMVKALLAHRVPLAAAWDRSMRAYLNADLSSEAARPDRPDTQEYVS
jgi:hypothetical protein